MLADRAQDEVARIRRTLAAADLPIMAEAEDLSSRDEQILAAVLGGETSASPAPARPSLARQRRGVRLAVAAAAVVAVVAGGIAWQTSRPGLAEARTPAMLRFSLADVDTVVSGEGPSAREALLDLAAVAAAQPAVAGEGDQEISSYAWYLDSSEDADGNRVTVLSPTSQTALIRPDGSLRNHQERGPALDVRGRVTGEYPFGPSETTDELPAGTVDANRGVTLPRDPAALRQVLAPDSCAIDEPAASECLVSSVMNLYNNAVVPPDLAAALWTTLADDPRVVDLGTTTDRIGRAGEAVAVPVTNDRGVMILIISTNDGSLLGWETVVPSMPEIGIDVPAVSSFQVFLSSRWVPES